MNENLETENIISDIKIHYKESLTDFRRESNIKCTISELGRQLSVKFLPCKHKDLSYTLRIHEKTWEW